LKITRTKWTGCMAQSVQYLQTWFYYVCLFVCVFCLVILGCKLRTTSGCLFLAVLEVNAGPWTC
jgi:hypothetical protein